MKTVWILRNYADYEGGSLLCVWEDKPHILTIRALFKGNLTKLSEKQVQKLIETGEFKPRGDCITYFLEEIKLGEYLGY
jgi:hypothetical protein